MRLPAIDWNHLNVLTLGLWGGLALLSLALLGLMLTRWGQTRPLSKCAILSVLAHGLLFGYAYATKLLVIAPAAPQEQVIRLAVIDRDQSADSPSTRPAEPWNQLAAPVSVQPRLVAPDRVQHPLTDVPSTAPVNDTARSDDRLPVEVDIEPAIERPTAPPPDQPRPTTPTSAEPAVVPVTDSNTQSTAQPIAQPLGPDAPALERIDVSVPVNVAADAATRSGPTPDPGIDVSQRIQRLVDVDIRSETADARRDARDDPHASANNAATSVTRHETAASSAGSAPRQDDTNIPSVDSLLRQLRSGAYQPPRRLADGQPVPAVYLLRMTPHARELARQLGASNESEQAVTNSLQWLASHQEPDGRWDASRFQAGQETRVLGHDRQGAGANADTGVTGLSVLAFLAAGHTHLEGTYRVTVQHGLEFLLRSQQPDGNLAGQAEVFASMYCHGMALLALSEAYALTGDQRLLPFVQRGVSYTLAAQNRTSGGWRYRPGDEGDMSQFGWQVMALKSAELAGIEVPSSTRAGMLRFMQRVAAGTHGGLACYKAGSRPTATMTAEALICRWLLSMEHNPAAVLEAQDMILSELPDQQQLNLYYIYYASLALFQLQGDAWDRWNERMQPCLIATQRTDGDLAGSWDPTTTWGSYGGRVYSTAMATLSLEVYYRYLPVLADR